MSAAKALFIPVGIASGFLAGFLAKTLFDQVWKWISDEEPPGPEQRRISMPLLVTALALEGAIFTITRGLVERLARTGFQRATGSWPGPEEAEEA